MHEDRGETNHAFTFNHSVCIYVKCSTMQKETCNLKQVTFLEIERTLFQPAIFSDYMIPNYLGFTATFYLRIFYFMAINL